MPIITTNLETHWDNQSELVKTIFNEFDKPRWENIFVQNKDYLLYKADVVDFGYERWQLNPLRFCHDHYGNQYFYLVVNLANNIGTIFEFYSDYLNGKIIAPKAEHISDVAGMLKNM